jgi:hypothetical protein
MLDKNGIEMKTGDVVKISGAYFQNDNGYFFIQHSPGDPTWNGTDYSLKKIRRNGKISTAKYSVSFYPLKSFTNSRQKAIEAKNYNESHATIEVITGIDRSEVAAFFNHEADVNDVYANRYSWDWGNDHPETIRIKNISEFYRQKAKEISA